MKLIKKTIKNKDIPADVKKKALAEIDKIAKIPRCNFIDSTEIIGAFEWRFAPSNSDFWTGIYDAPEMGDSK